MRKRDGVWYRFGRGLLRVLVWVAVIGAAAYLSSAWYLPAVVQRQLAGRLEGAATIQGARFSGVGVLITGLAVAEEDSLLAQSPIFFAERVRVGFAPTALLRRRAVVRSVAVRDAVLTVEYERGVGWNVERLGVRPGEGKADRLPTVRIERGALRVRQIVDGQRQTIATVGLAGRLTAMDEAGAYAVWLAADERFGLSGSRADGTLRLGADGQQHRLSLAGVVRMPGARILDNVWNLDEVSLACAFDGDSVQLERLTFAMAGGRGEVSGQTSDGAFEATVRLDGFELSDTPKVDTVVYGEPAMAVIGPVADRFLRRYQPRGFGDVDLRVRGRWDAIAASEVFGQVICRDIAVMDARFPYPFEQMQGVIVFSGRSLTLDSLTCRHGEATFVMAGGIEDFGPAMEIRLRVVSDEMRFDEAVYRALGTGGKRLWFAFAPSGTGAIDYTYRRFADRQRTQRLAVELIDAGAVYEHFPYPLEHLTGRVVFEPDAITLHDVTAHYQDARQVRLDGSVTMRPDAEPDFALRVRAEQIPVDAMLIGAMPPPQQDFFERFDVEATATVDVRVFPDATGQRPMDYTAHLEATGSHLVYAGFAVPLEEVHIAADITQERVELRRFTARRGDGELSLHGQMMGKGKDGQSPGLCVEVAATGFALDEVFWAAAADEIARFPAAFRLGGAVEVAGRWSRNMPTGDCPPMDLRIVCDGNPVLIDGRPAARASGGLRFEPERVRLEAFRIEELALNESLTQMMPERMRQAYERLGIAGRLDAEIETAVLTLDEEDFGGIDVTGQLTLTGVETEETDAVKSLDAVLDGRIRLDAEERIEQIEATYRVASFLARGRTIDQLTGGLVYAPETGVLASRDIRVEVAGGLATGSMTLDIGNEETFLAYALDMMFEGIEVSGIANTETVPDDDERISRGKAGGRLTLQGRLGHSASKQGKLEAVVSKMRMGRQSLIGKVLTAIQFREPKEYVFDKMEIEAFVVGDEVVCDHVRIVGRPFVFHGDGRVHLKTHRIEMDLVALGGLAGFEPVILDSLLRGLGSVFWKIEIRGDLREPEIRTVSLPILQLPLELFRR